MSSIKFGCQFYTWQMSGDRYIGKLPHILQVVDRAGFSGIEPETCMLGSYYEDPLKLKDVLNRYNLRLGAIALVCNWSGPVESEADRTEAERIIEYLKPFPETHLLLCQFAGKDRSNLRYRQENMIRCVNAVACRASDRGIACSFHPNSPPGSLFRIQEDYQFLLDHLDNRFVGFAPDTGHIAKGGMDVLEILNTYRPLVKHIHFKDIKTSGEWTAMGSGMIDFPQIVTGLRATGYSGWIMIEEESREAEVNPDAATLKNGDYLQQSLIPLL